MRGVRARRSGPAIPGPGEARLRSAELSLTPLAIARSSTGSRRVSPSPTSGRTRPRRRSCCSAGAGSKRTSTLGETLRRRADDLGVLVEWAEAGEDVDARPRSRASTSFQPDVEAAETRKMLGGEHDRAQRHRHHPSRAPAAPSRRTGPRCCCACTCAGRERRGFKREVIDYQPGDEAGIKSATLTRHRRVRVRPAVGRGRRPSAGAHLAVRSGGAPPHVVRVGVRLAGAARRHRHRDPGKGPAHRHLPLERRRRPARQRHRLGRAHHAPADRHRRVVPERALAAPQPRRRR